MHKERRVKKSAETYVWLFCPEGCWFSVYTVLMSGDTKKSVIQTLFLKGSWGKVMWSRCRRGLGGRCGTVMTSANIRDCPVNTVLLGLGRGSLDARGRYLDRSEG